jgi:aspartyl aminopeptidase
MMNDSVQTLVQMVQASVSPYHCVEEGSRLLRENGFEELVLGDFWDLESGKSYFCNVFGTTLMAFKIPDNYYNGMEFHIAAAHTDWPCFKIKPFPENESGRYAKLNVETYGGPIFSSWLDRPLSIAGRVALKSDNLMQPTARLVNFDRPLLTIPNLAIHFNRDVNKGTELNAQIDMQPILQVLPKEWQMQDYFINLLAEELDVQPEEILSFDLNLYNQDGCALVGADSQLLSSPRLDNLTSCAACLLGLINSKNEDTVSVVTLFDNEEVGSGTKQGADSLILPQLLEKLILSLGGSKLDYMNAVLNGLMLSVDVAHAIHPNKPNFNDITNKNYPGDGVAIKMNYSQRYATDPVAIGIVENLCQVYDIPYCRYLNRSDIRGGSTLGSMASALLTMKTVDIGVSLLAMHSARELMAISDQDALTELLTAFFNN